MTLVEMPPLIVTEPDAVSEMAASVMPMKSVLFEVKGEYVIPVP